MFINYLAITSKLFKMIFKLFISMCLSCLSLLIKIFSHDHFFVPVMSITFCQDVFNCLFMSIHFYVSFMSITSNQDIFIWLFLCAYHVYHFLSRWVFFIFTCMSLPCLYSIIELIKMFSTVYLYCLSWVVSSLFLCHYYCLYFQLTHCCFHSQYLHLVSRKNRKRS